MRTGAGGLRPRRSAAVGLAAGLLAGLLATLAGCATEPAAHGIDGSRPTGSQPASPPLSGSRPAGPFLRVLGTAQDGGFPHAACDGVRCAAARENPALRRLVASLALVLPDAGEVYLIDATPDIREQLDRLADVRDAPDDGVDRAPVDGVFLTHAHIGHYLGLAFLGFEAIHTRDLPVWATPRMAAFLSGQGPWDQLVRLGNISLEELRQGTPVSLAGGVAIEPLWVPHRDEYTDTVGFRITGPSRTVLYIPDTDPWRLWPEPLERALEGVDIALLDGAFYSADELPGRKVEEIRHPLVGETIERLAPLVDAGPLVVYFTHINHSNPVLTPDSPERRAVEARGFRILDELAEIDL